MMHRAMLFGSMKESHSNTICVNSNDIDNGIKIPDVTPNAFDFLIKYIHGLNPTVTKENVVDILYLSKKYLIQTIENACLTVLKAIFETIESVDDIFNIARKLNEMAMNVCYMFVDCLNTGASVLIEFDLFVGLSKNFYNSCKDVLLSLSAEMPLTPSTSHEIINSKNFVSLPAS